MARKGRARLRALIDKVQEAHPSVDATHAIREGRVRVAGLAATNPRSLVPDDAAITLHRESDDELRGERKLEAALEAFGIDVTGEVALDLGASAGGFSRVLLRHGAARVYAVDVGFGQLAGFLRQHPRVVNLERTNLGDLTEELISDTVGVVTADLSYISLARALPQLNGRVAIARKATLVALVKPQFELGLAGPPRTEAALKEAAARASAGAEASGWSVVGALESPVRGRRGSRELLLHGRRKQ